MNPAEALTRDGFAVIDGFLDAPRVRCLAQGALERRARGEFREARVGHGGGLARNEQVRGDSTCWIEPPFAPQEAALLEDLEQLRRSLNLHLQLGLFDLELHFATYPPGAGYQRHLDQPRGRQQRRISLVLYLNEDWGAGDAGQLRLHAASGTVDVLPIGGRLVCFLSATHEHEVLPATRARLSVCGWFLARAT